MNLIPVHYVSVHVGMAQTDDALAELFSSLVWRLEVPRGLRKTAQGRRDIIVAMLRGDDSSLARCHPYLWLHSRIPLRLSRVALRHELIPLVNRIAVQKRPSDLSLAGVRDINETVQGVVFLNGNRCDCTTINLREVI